MASCHARTVMLRRKDYETDEDYNIALIIALHMGSDGRPATISLATIAEHIHRHYNTADKRTKYMSSKGMLIIGKSGRLLTYAIPYDGDDGESEGNKEAAGEVVQLRQEVMELKEQVTKLTTIVTSLSHDLHTMFTPPHRDYVNEVGKIEDTNPPLPPKVSGAGGAAEKNKTQVLVSHFSDKARIKTPPKRNLQAWREGWIDPLNEILELVGGDPAAGCTLVDRSLAYMRENGLSIARPSSILSVAKKLHQQTNGRKSEPSPWDEVKAQASNRGNPTFSNPLILAAVRPIWPDVRKMTPATEKQLRTTFEQKYQELSHARN